MNERSKWSEAEIRAIVRDELKKCQEIFESDTDDSSSFFDSIKKKFDESERKNKKKIADLENELKICKHITELSQMQAECQKRDNTLYIGKAKRLEIVNNEYERRVNALESKIERVEAVNKAYKERINDLEKDINSYEQSFGKVYVLYNEVCSISEKDRAVFQRFICTDDAVRFMYAVTNEKAMNSLYDYMMYELKNMSETVFGIYNRLLAFMCSINKDYELIGCKGKIDDRYHIDIEKKHSGEIKRIVIGGYKYAVSGDAVKKALVEV